MSEASNEFGLNGERAAREYLEKKGYRWHVSNYQTRWGELDLVMNDKGTIVFIEVKRRRGDHYGEPEEAVTSTKIRHLEKAAFLFLIRFRLIGKPLRFDVVSIGPGGVRHLENAFLSSGDYYY